MAQLQRFSIPVEEDQPGPNLKDSEVLTGAFDGRYGIRFSKLWSGDYRGAGFDCPYEAEKGLCAIVNHYVGDGPRGDKGLQIERIVKRSALCNYEGWNSIEQGGRPHSRRVIGEVVAISCMPKEDERGRMVKTYTLSDLLALDIPPPRFIVAGLINAGDTALLVGRPKVGKSRLMQQLATDLSEGNAFLGREIVGPQKVLILDLENRPNVVKERFLMMRAGEASRKAADDNIVIYAPMTLSTNEVGLEGDREKTLHELVRTVDPNVLIIDTWRLLLGKGDENKSGDVVDGLKHLAKLREIIPDLAIVIVHHLRKQNSDLGATLRTDPYAWVENVSGHHALVGHVDSCWGIEREANGVIVFGGVARNANVYSKVLDEDLETLRFSVKASKEAFQAALTPTEKALFFLAEQAFYRTTAGLTYSDLDAATHPKSSKTLASLLAKAQEFQLIKKTREGKGALYVWIEGSDGSDQ